MARLAPAQDNYFGNVVKRFCFLCVGFGYAFPEGGGSAKTAETNTQNTRAFFVSKERMANIADFDCTDHVTQLTYIVTANGMRQYRFQCIKCGQVVGKHSIKFSDLSRQQQELARPFSSELQREKSAERWDMYRAEQEAERTAESLAWWQEHKEYLSSQEWKFKRLLVLQRDHHTCTANMIGCTHAADDVHHLTYDHWKNEPLFDLASVCRHCHNMITTMDRERRSR